MTGGQIGSLNQGGNYDTFFMSGGHIVGGFDDGDYAVMTGGRISRVNLKLADNVFMMSDGAIDNNLVAGFGNDTIDLSGGMIGGNISVSGGTDIVTVTGGTVGGEVRMSVGNDTFTWGGGGIIFGAIDLGGDDDTVSLSNLTDTNIGTIPQLTGGTGTDALIFDNVKTGDVARFDSWETINLINNSQLSFDETLTLGDAGTDTGSLTVDSTSTIFGGEANGGVAAFTAGQFVDVVNAGRIDLTNGGDSVNDTFTIAGNYTGGGGQIFLNTVLGDDTSASDTLVIDGGTASGTTGMNIINFEGTGDSTTQDGIMVVEAINAATTDSGAFALNSRVAAGAYEYALYKGGISANTKDNWYLRSALVTPPGALPPEPAQTPDSVELTPEATPVIADVVPLYRIEVPTYAIVPPLAHHLALSTLGTFHERRGEQMLLHGTGWLPTTWARVFGQNAEMKWGGTVAPSFDGSLFGIQAGQDVFGHETDNGHFDRFGFFIGHANMDGDVKGQALGWNDLDVGDIALDGTSFGGYWTHIGPQGWYVDTVLIGTWFNGDASSNSGESIDTNGTGVTASLEGGYPLALTDQWTLEPQGQIIWQRLSLDSSEDSFSAVSFDTDDVVTGRLGFRLQGNYQTSAGLIQPYFKANLWHNFSSDQTTRFYSDAIPTEIGGTSLEFGGGLIANLTEKASLFATADYTTKIGGEKKRNFEGNIGLSIKW